MRATGGAQKSETAVAASASIAQNVSSTGTLNIGAPAGRAPVAPGTLNTPTVTFGAGTGDIVFNHTDTTGNYKFAPAVSGTWSCNGAIGRLS